MALCEIVGDAGSRRLGRSCVEIVGVGRRRRLWRRCVEIVGDAGIWKDERGD